MPRLLEFVDGIEQGKGRRGVELPGGGQVALQLGIHTDGRRFGDFPCIPSEFNDIEKIAVNVPPYDLSYGGYNFRSGQIAPADHTVPSAFPQKRTGVFGIARAEGFIILTHHGHRWPAIKGF